MADIFRAHGSAYLDSHALPPHVADVLRAVIASRTSALGGHVWKCDTCGEKLPVYNSCNDRHCPICQYPRQQRWVAARMERLLPDRHSHVVFTLPAQLRPLCMVNAALVLDLLFKTASSTLKTLGRQRIGGLLGVTAVLHTWGGQIGSAVVANWPAGPCGRPRSGGAHALAGCPAGTDTEEGASCAEGLLAPGDGRVGTPGAGGPARNPVGSGGALPANSLPAGMLDHPGLRGVGSAAIVLR